MKLPFKLIAVLVVVSLSGTFAYQTYWLASLYRSMKTELEQSIIEAMRNSDFNELLLRIERIKREGKQHGSVEVEVSNKAENDSATRSSTNVVIRKILMADSAQEVVFQRKETVSVVHLQQKQSGKDSIMVSSSGESFMEGELTDMESEDNSYSALTSSNGLAVILKKQRDMTELATFFQRGLHSGVDVLTEPDFNVYDSLLTLRLKEKGIVQAHRLEYLHTGSTFDSSYVYTDTLTVAETEGYTPGKKARQYVYAFDMHTHHLYRLTMEPIDMLVWKQMSGILATSFVIFVILVFSYWLLIRTILRQKTLEELKSDFTNNITHELKTPIAVAYAANDALLNYSLSGDEARCRKYLTICQEQLLRLSGLVEQILSMSMERRKTFRLHPELLSLSDILPALIEQHKLKADKPVWITLDIQPHNLSVTADRTHFINIVSNLLDNAIKYSQGEAIVSIDCCYTSDGKTEVAVSDCGIGISADKQKLIFDKFYRVPSGDVHNTKGYGLGLFYVKTMVDRHGGRVELRSEAGKGSRFSIQI